MRSAAVYSTCTPPASCATIHDDLLSLVLKVCFSFVLMTIPKRRLVWNHCHCEACVCSRSICPSILVPSPSLNVILVHELNVFPSTTALCHYNITFTLLFQSTRVKSELIYPLICFTEGIKSQFNPAVTEADETERHEANTGRVLSPNELSLINIVTVWMKRTISRELQDNAQPMFIYFANSGPFIMKFYWWWCIATAILLISEAAAWTAFMIVWALMTAA